MERGKLKAIANVEQLTLPLAQPSLVNRRVQVFEGSYLAPGVGVVMIDRGNGCVEVKMETTGRVQIISKGGYQLVAR